MYIKRTIDDKLEIYSGTDENRIELTTWNHIGGCRCKWISVSLTPDQAIKVANDLRCPPKRQSVKLCPMWQVYKIKHRNGGTRGMIGISEGKETMLGLNDDFISSGKDEDKTRLTDYFYCTKVNLTSKEVITVSGLLFLWAGSKFVGTRQICKTTKENVLNTKDEKR